MPNRNLTTEELVAANLLLNEIRAKLVSLSAGEQELLFAYRRKIAKELSYDERGKPTHRKLLRARKMGEQLGLCAICSKQLPEKYAVLDRLKAIEGYTADNVRLIHAECDIEAQRERKYS